MKKYFALALALFSLPALGATTRTLDGQQITNGAATLTLPTTTDTLTGRTTTDTLTNKTIDGGSNTFTNIPAASALTGTLPVANGGTGASSAATGAAALLGGLSGYSTAGGYLTTNGTTASFAPVPSTSPTLTGTQASPSAITAAGGVTLTTPTYTNVAFIAGSGAAVTVTATPQVSGCASGVTGASLRLIGESGTNTVTLNDGTGLSLNGKWVGSLNSVLNLTCDGTTWVETARR